MRQRGLHPIVPTFVLLACACGPSAPDRALVERFCGEGRRACVERCSGGGSYVPEACRAACDAGRDACLRAQNEHCEGFGVTCVSGCDTPRCAEACEAGAAACTSL